MPTNNEKRYFTAVLRYASTKASTLSVQEILRDILGVGGSEIFGRLADLIDPDTTGDTTTDTTKSQTTSLSSSLCDRRVSAGSSEATPKYSEATPKCDTSATHTDASATVSDAPATCDREALLALAGCVRKMGEDYRKIGAFGPGVTFCAIADRIREACGASSDA